MMLKTLSEKDLSLKREGKGERYALIMISEAKGGGALYWFALLTMCPHNQVEIIE